MEDDKKVKSAKKIVTKIVPPKEQEAIDTLKEIESKPLFSCLSQYIQSRLVGSAGLMSLPAKKVLLWIRSLGAMPLANATRMVLALCALPWWWIQATNTEWMGSHSPQR
jgi:hypothetical protein